MLVLKGAKRPVKSLSFSPDGALLASAGSEGVVRLWNALDGQALEPITLPKDCSWPLPTVRFAPDSRHLVISSCHLVLSVWDTRERTLVKQLARSSTITGSPGIGFARDGRLLAARCEKEGKGLWAWDSTTWEELPPLWKPRETYQKYNLMAIEPDGDRVAIGTGVLLDCHSGAEVGRWGPGIHAFVGRGGSVMEWCPNKPLLAVCNRGKTIEVTDPNTAATVACLTSPTKYYEALAFTPDGHHLITVSNDKSARFYDTGTWEARQTLDWRIGALKSIAVAADGSRAAAGSGSTYSGKVVIWDLD
jgi:WD40 repeat protein